MKTAVKTKEKSENLKKMSKGKIDEISSKYIVKGLTADYALCYFPSDEIY